MPLHLNSITNNSGDSELLAAILQDELQACDSVYVDPTRKYIHMTKNIVDLHSGNGIGKYVFTVLIRDDALEVLDLDIVWNNPAATEIHFLERRNESSDANEYYDAETADSEQHFQLETVSRHVLADERLDDMTIKAFISAFPFELNIFPDMDSFNRHMGFDHVINVADTGLTVGGLSDTFLAPGNIIKRDSEDETFSFVVGTIREYSDVQIKIGKQYLSFVLAQVETAFGTIPVGMGRDVFDIAEIKNSCIVAMNADIKADLAKPGDYQSGNKK